MHLVLPVGIRVRLHIMTIPVGAETVLLTSFQSSIKRCSAIEDQLALATCTVCRCVRFFASGNFFSLWMYCEVVG